MMRQYELAQMVERNTPDHDYRCPTRIVPKADFSLFHEFLLSDIGNGIDQVFYLLPDI
jgi:hypothetical protein